eukprot:PITA_01446
MSRFSASVLLLVIMVSLWHFEMIAGVTDSGDASMILLIQRQLQNTPSTWKRGDPCGSEWVGVSCVGSRITSLLLSSTNVTGQLPYEIGRLSALQILDLSYNPGLTGPIPSSLGNLQQLHTLILTGCSFNGRIPTELGKLQKLLTLDVNSNSLSGSIPPLGNLTKLSWFDFGNNSIGGELPVELKGLVNCSHFHFNKNQLRGSIPPEIFHENMNLVHLLLDDNLFTGEIPSTLGNVSTLEIVRLDRNSFEGQTPVSIRQLGQLYSLNLSNNRLIGSIPDLSGMSNLQLLDLSHNPFELSVVPTWLSELESLNTVMMENSSLNGQLPSEVFSAPQLETVILSHNSIDGSLQIDDTFSQQMQLMDFQYNNITRFLSGSSYSNTLLLKGNPVCDSPTLGGNLCQPEAAEQTPYETDMTQCGNHVTCPQDFLKVDPRSCECAAAYGGVMVFKAPRFSVSTNTTRFHELENSLCTNLNLTKGSVYIRYKLFDSNGYLNIQVRLFPSPGRKYFERLQLVKILYALSNHDYASPLGFGPYYFISIELYNFLDEGSKNLSQGAIIGIAIGATLLIFAIIAVGVYALLQRKKAAKAVELSNPFASWGKGSRRESGNAPKLKGARFFSFQELKMATNNFSKDNEIGSGGYGKVRKF